MSIKKDLKTTLFIFFSIFFFTSCSSYNFSGNYSNDTNSTNLEELVIKLVHNSSPALKSIINSYEIVLVSDFVNLQNLKNTSQLGFLLSDIVKDKLLKLNILVREIKLGKEFTIGENGFSLLSNNSKKILNNEVQDSNFALVGTYSIRGKNLNLFLKLINIHTGIIQASSYEKAQLNKNTLELETTNKVKIRPHLVL